MNKVETVPATGAGGAEPAAGTGNMEPAPGAGDMEPAPGAGDMEPAPGAGDMEPAPGAGDMEPAPGAGRNRKTDQLMRGARKVFMERGFEGASVDEIARAAGASKATLYSYFPDKRQLFTAVVRAGCLRQGGDVALGRLDPDEPIEAALRRIAGEFGAFVLSAGAVEMFRTCIAEAGRFPELGRAFHEAGPGRARAQLAALLDDAVARGELAIEDTGLAADQFAALAKARVFLATLLGQTIAADDPELARVADEAVATFLARYAARPA